MTARPTARRAAALLCLLPLAACTQDNPLDEPGPAVDGGNAAVDENLGEDVRLTDVELAYPQDGQYAEGEDAELYVAIANSGSEPAVLTDVSGPDFADVEVSGAEGGLPLEVPEDVLLDLSTDLRSSQSIPVTFTFEEIGEVTMDVAVAASPREAEQTGTDFDDPDEDPTEDSGTG
jgi:copper(I)-binding protein